MTLDFRSVSYILRSPLYEKPWQTRAFLSRFLGVGMLFKLNRRVEYLIILLIILPPLGLSALEGKDHSVLVSIIMFDAHIILLRCFVPHSFSGD
jgi:hypothetical protein